MGSFKSHNTSEEVNSSSRICTSDDIAVRPKAGTKFLQRAPTRFIRALSMITLIRSSSVPTTTMNGDVITSTVCAQSGRPERHSRGHSCGTRSSACRTVNTSIWSEEDSRLSHTYDLIPSLLSSCSHIHYNTYDIIGDPTYANLPSSHTPQSLSPTYANIPCLFPNSLPPTYANIPSNNPPSFSTAYETLQSRIFKSFPSTYENFTHHIHSLDHTYHTLDPAYTLPSPIMHGLRRSGPEGVSEKKWRPRKSHRGCLPDISLTCIPLDDPQNYFDMTISSFLSPAYENLQTHLFNIFSPAYKNFVDNHNCFGHFYHILDPACRSPSPNNQAFLRSEHDVISNKKRHPRKAHHSSLPDISLPCIPLDDPLNITMDELPQPDLALTPACYVNSSLYHR